MSPKTGIREEAIGHVGSKPAPKVDTTKTGRPRIRFDLACGQNKEDIGQFTTWRHCILYGDAVETLKLLQVGDLVKVSGWVSTEWLLDEDHKPVTDSEGNKKQKEYLVLYNAEIIEYQRQSKLQPALMN